MAQILMFFYSLIIFFFLFLVETKRTNIPCFSDDDCPKTSPPLVLKCDDYFCRYFREKNLI
nr:Late nodulin [Medicago truncatula]